MIERWKGMKLWSTLLLLFMLGVSSSCSIPADQGKSDRVAGNEKIEQALGRKPAADFAEFPSVSFHLTGMKKAKSGAT